MTSFCSSSRAVQATPVVYQARNHHHHSGPQIRQGYPLNLSILISGGKETNKDSLSNGE